MKAYERPPSMESSSQRKKQHALYSVQANHPAPEPSVLYKIGIAYPGNTQDNPAASRYSGVMSSRLAISPVSAAISATGRERRLTPVARRSTARQLASWIAAFTLMIATTIMTTPMQAAEDAAAKMHALFDREWEYVMKESPTWASSLGDRRWNDQWGDIGLEAVQRRQEHEQALLAEFNAIPRASLTAADQLNFDLFKRDLESSMEGARYRLYLMPITMRDGIQLADDLADALRFETVKDYEDWIGRLRRFPTYMSQTIGLMREGMAARILQPKVVMRRVPAQIARQITEKPDDNPFFKPFTKFPTTIPAAEQDRLKTEARAAVITSIEPAFRDFQKFFTDEYLPACFDDVGAWQLPQGRDCYAFLARRFTTTTLTPQQIHEIGLAEVKRIRSEMEKIKSDAGFNGTLPEYFHFLKTDPRFFYQSPAELLAGYEAVTVRINPTLPRIFRTQPRIRYKVQAIPAKVAPDTTAAYYRQPAADGSRDGTFFVNLYKPESRPKWEMMALSLHESVPGHHFQIALAQEQGALPMFRRHMEFTAYVEGWALYCESLGDELGLYSDRYDKFGQLTYEMWRAVRLVVDTGIHELKWSREKAIAFFMENAPKTELDVTNEVDRYIGWPGQALAYKIGQMRIRELRTHAEKELGARFDLKAFHDAVLLGGSMPLDILETRVNDFVKASKNEP